MWGGLIYADWCKLGARSLKIDLALILSGAERSGASRTLHSRFVARAVETQRLTTVEAICFGVRVTGTSWCRVSCWSVLTDVASLVPDHVGYFGKPGKWKASGSCRESCCFRHFFFLKKEGKKTVCSLMAPSWNFQQQNPHYRFIQHHSSFVLIQNINGCIIDGLKTMILQRSAHAYSCSVASHRALRCAHVCCKKLMRSRCNWCEYFMHGNAEGKQELTAKEATCFLLRDAHAGTRR